ncbi:MULTISPECIES: hypothetical protein [Bacteroides]|uniref:hypothetical protein n=1 Tax=Bacteroides TaxID=816 RepID=UPI0032611D41
MKDVSTLSLHILKKNAPATVFNEIPAGYLASDTLVWLSTTADASGLTLSFRGYARCPAAMLFSLSKQTSANRYGREKTMRTKHSIH